MNELWREAMIDGIQQTTKRAALFLPNLFAMMTLLVIGLLAGIIAKVFLVRVLGVFRFDPLCDRWGLNQALMRAGLKQTCSQLAGRLVFWVLFLLFAFMGVDALNLPAAASLTTIALRFLPQVLTALVLFWAGWLLANFLAQGSLVAAVNAQIKGARLIANLVRWGVLIFTVATVLTQLGIAKEIVVAAFSITFGGVILALALAFGLGGRDLAKELLERRLHGEKEQEGGISHL